MHVYKVGSFELNAERLTLRRDGRGVNLGPKVVDTLLALVEHEGKILSKTDLLNRIWPEGFVEEANLAQNIYVLRKTFDRFGEPNPIQTAAGLGYRLTALVRYVSQDPPPAIPPSVIQSRRSPGARSLPAWAFLGAALLVFVLALGAHSDSALKIKATQSSTAENDRLYKAGRYFWNLRTRNGVEKSLEYFARVIETDPLNERGYAALAEAYLTMGEYCYGTHDPAVYFARARAYAMQALNFNADSAEAHAALGFLALRRNDLVGANAELKRALAMDQSNSEAHEWYGIALIRQGRRTEGLSQLRVSANLNPLSVSTIAWLGELAYLDHRYRDAIRYAQQALELSPQRVDSLRVIGESYEALGNVQAAIEAFRKYGAMDRFYTADAAALLSRAYALSDQKVEALRQLSYARANQGNVYGPDLQAAETALGHKSREASANEAASHEWSGSVEFSLGS